MAILKAACTKINHDLDEDNFEFKNPNDLNKHEEARDQASDLIVASIGILDDHCGDLIEPGYWESLKVWEKYNFPTLKGSEGENISKLNKNQNN